MDENVNNNGLLAEINVPYNNELMVADRKKSKITMGILFLVAFAFCAGVGIWGFIDGSITIALVFVLIAAGMLGLVIYSFCTIKASAKDENILINYSFYEEYLQIRQDNSASNGKVKMLENCVYRPFKNKQYVAKVFEFADKIQLKIYTGTTNGAPNYHTHIIPKVVFKTEEELTSFTTFLKDKFGGDYVVKLEK